MIRLLQAARLWRKVFWCYAAVLFIGTHTPNVKFGTEIRVDLVVHLGAFGAWAGLLLLAAYFGAFASWANTRAVWLIAVVYAAADEGLQAIPFVHRHAALDDWAANVCGITIACAGVLVVGRRLQKRAGPGTR